jgi:hypothetical protein
VIIGIASVLECAPLVAAPRAPARYSPRVRPLTLLAAVTLWSLAACGGAAATTRATRPTPRTARRAAPAPAPPVDAGAATSPPVAEAPAGPSASDRVRAALEGTAAVPADEAAWFPFRVLEIVARASGELPAPTAPTIHDDVTVWSLVLPATAAPRDPVAQGSACAEVARVEPRIACAVDTLTVGATERVRLAFGWRRAPGLLVADLALPLRALARLPGGVCLLSAERTLRTVELEVRASDVRALGTALALMATVPRLSDVIMVRAEPVSTPQGQVLRALLSWPTDRADRTVGDLGHDPWPVRCEGHATLGADAPPRAILTALALLRGERAQGAVVNLARHEYLVTEGDQLGDATVTSVSEQGVYVRRGTSPRARPVLLRFATRPPAAPQPPGGAPATTMPTRPPRIPLPPEPPAPTP